MPPAIFTLQNHSLYKVVCLTNSIKQKLPENKNALSQFHFREQDRAILNHPWEIINIFVCCHCCCTYHCHTWHCRICLYHDLSLFRYHCFCNVCYADHNGHSHPSDHFFPCSLDQLPLPADPLDNSCKQVEVDNKVARKLQLVEEGWVTRCQCRHERLPESTN